MIEKLDAQGYEQTKAKIARLEQRLAAIQARDDLDPPHRQQVVRSYNKMIQQYRREIKRYEVAQEQRRV